MPSPLTRDERLRRQALVNQCLLEGFNPPGDRSGRGSALSEAALRDGRANNFYHVWMKTEENLQASGEEAFLPDWGLYVAPEGASPVVEEDPQAERRESHDSSFWKKRYKDAAKELAKVELMLEEVGALRNTPIQPASWLYQPSADGKRNRSVPIMLFTDLHYGEVIDRDEILGVNEYNPQVAEARVKRFFEAACEIGPRWGSDTQIEGLVLALGGDLVSGDIHEELRQTNGLTTMEQARGAASIIAAGIRRALEIYAHIHVVSVPGNHGRSTFKPTAKLYARLSYDTLIAQLVSDLFAGDPRVTFQIGSAPDAIIPVLGHSFFLTHGDKMGSGGGQGFAGPMLPIVRGTKKVEAQQARAGRRPDYILHGHYHHSGNPGNVFSNGAFPGYSEYGNGLRCSLEPAQQWLLLVHEYWGVRERAEIKLQDMTPPEKPVVRIPAGMAYSS